MRTDSALYLVGMLGLAGAGVALVFCLVTHAMGVHEDGE